MARKFFAYTFLLAFAVALACATVVATDKLIFRDCCAINQDTLKELDATTKELKLGYQIQYVGLRDGALFGKRNLFYGSLYRKDKYYVLPSNPKAYTSAWTYATQCPEGEKCVEIYQSTEEVATQAYSEQEVAEKLLAHLQDRLEESRVRKQCPTVLGGANAR